MPPSHPPIKEDEWLITRTLAGHKAIVRAVCIPSLHIWGLTCKLDGVLIEHCQSDQPLIDAQIIINKAFALFV